jgi:NADH:ubiquinone oxidoreductase subunit E
MPQRKTTEEYPPEPRRKEIFHALVDAQDQEMSVAQSRKLVAERFGLSESQVRQIEQEGLDREWPPL